MREQFGSEHSIEKGGTEKYYLALVHGEVSLPDDTEQRHMNPNSWGDYDKYYWQHGPEENPRGDPRGRIEVWQGPHTYGRANAFDPTEHTGSPLWSLTMYEPIAWFKSNQDGKPFTLLQLQIITGRRHQIRLHCAEIGHVLAGDYKYDRSIQGDRTWC